MFRSLRDRHPYLMFAEEPPTDDGAGGGNGGGGSSTPRTFTQEEVNAFLAKELGPLREQLKTLKPAADELAKIKESQQTDLERLTARAEEAEKKVADYEAKAAHAALVDKIASEKKLNAKAKGLLAKSSIRDEAALAEYAAELAEAISTAPTIPTPLYTASTDGSPVNGKEAAARATAAALLKQQSRS